MNPASGCAFTEGDFERWNCRMLRPDDVLGVASLWGGRWAPKLPKGCPRERSGPTAIPASWRKPPPGEPVKPPRGGPLNPSNLAASYDPSGDGTPVSITFRNTTSSLLGSVHVDWKENVCPRSEDDGDVAGGHVVRPATPGQEVRIDSKLSWVQRAAASDSSAWRPGASARTTPSQPSLRRRSGAARLQLSCGTTPGWLELRLTGGRMGHAGLEPATLGLKVPPELLRRAALS